MDVDSYGAIERLQSIADATGNGLPAFDRTTGGITLYWFGTLPPTISAITADYDDTVPIDVVSTPYRYGDLLQEADRLISEHSTVVSVVAPRTQADGIDVSIFATAVETAGGIDAVLEELDSPLPLYADVGQLVPINLPTT